MLIKLLLFLFAPIDLFIFVLFFGLVAGVWLWIALMVLLYVAFFAMRMLVALAEELENKIVNSAYFTKRREARWASDAIRKKEYFKYLISEAEQYEKDHPGFTAAGLSTGQHH